MRGIRAPKPRDCVAENIAFWSDRERSREALLSIFKLSEMGDMTDGERKRLRGQLREALNQMCHADDRGWESPPGLAAKGAFEWDDENV